MNSKAGLHYLARFMARQDAEGRTYFSGVLGNSRLLLFPDEDGNLRFYLGGRVEGGENRVRMPYKARTRGGVT